jgi:predicted phage terminase large subunit-like protein
LLALASYSPSGLATIANWRPGETRSSWEHAAHVAYLDDHLRLLAARELRKAGYIGLIIEEPPRHGKSELASHYFPAWYLGKFPQHRVLLASYEAEFAESWGRKTRATFEQWGEHIFDLKISKRSKAANRWDIHGKTGGMYTAGVGGALTGRGANVLIIDDPVKNAADARSQTLRDNQWDWYRSVARTRVEPEGVILVIGTRWHEDDMIGRILAQMDDPGADQFLRIRLPMIAEDDDPLGRTPGEPLWPTRFNAEAAAQIRASVGDYYWSAMYQQRPSPPEGGRFKRDNFPIVGAHEVPKLRRVVRYWDLAATEEGKAKRRAEDPDYTVGLKAGKDEQGRIYVLDVVRFRDTAAGVEAQVAHNALSDGTNVRVWMEQEPGASGKSLISYYARKVIPAGVSFRGNRNTGSKELRAEIAAGKSERGEIILVKAPWNEKFFDEVTFFPFGSHDDQVDALSGAVDKLESKGGTLVSW